MWCSLKMTGLMGEKGGSSAKVALSWQLAYNKAGQGSPAAQHVEESHPSTPLLPRLSISFMGPNTVRYVVIDFNISYSKGLRAGQWWVWERGDDVRVLQRSCSLPSVSWCWRKCLCSISAANGWRGFFLLKKKKKKKKLYIVEHLIISAAAR